MVTIYLTAGKSIGSFLIRFFTWSKWSHAFIKDGDHVIEAKAFTGVQRVPLDEALKHATRVATIEVASNNPEQILDAVRSQVGKGYDYMGVFGFLFRRNWQRTDKWLCSELLAWGFNQAQEPIFRGEDVARVSPAHWWLLSPSLTLRKP